MWPFKKKIISPISDNYSVPIATRVEPTVGGFTKSEYKRAIEEGMRHWNPNPPAATLSGEMADAIFKYPILQKFPFLLPGISLNESGLGTKITYRNNPLNWGIKAQKKKLYQPESWVENVRSAASGIGGRTLQEGYTPAQVSTSSYYEPFRKSGNLEDFSSAYAPLSENPNTGGPFYTKNLRASESIFRSKLRKGR